MFGLKVKCRQSGQGPDFLTTTPWVFLKVMIIVEAGSFYFIYSFKHFTYLFLERGEGREKERKRNFDVKEKHQSSASSVYSDLGPSPQPRHVP